VLALEGHLWAPIPVVEPEPPEMANEPKSPKES
jgi:hypothetical protein